jgi:C4-dicarboxylate transporter, DctM subunit
MTIVAYFTARRRKFPIDAAVPLGEWPGIIFRALLPLSLPVVLLGGIYSGVFTPTEAAAIGAAYAMLIAAFIYRAIGPRTLYTVFLESLRSSAVVTLIIAGAFLISYAFTAEQIPMRIAALIDGFKLSQLQFLLLVNVMFLILGCFLDTSVMLLVIVPLLLPAAKLLGVDFVHFGVVAIVNMMIGLITPPYGVLLFVLNGITGIPLREIIAESWWFILGLAGVLLLMTLWPATVLWLPHYFGYK